MIEQYVHCARRKCKKVIKNLRQRKMRNQVTHVTASYMLPSEKLISDSPSRIEISSASKVAYAYHCHQHHGDNYYTERYYGYQRSTGKIRKVPVEL